MIHCFSGQFITNLAKKNENDKIETSNGANKSRNNNNNNNSKNLRVNVDSKAAAATASQDDDGFGSLPITPTDLGKNKKSLSVLKKGEADCDSLIATDDGIYTSSEDAINRQSCESVSDELSVTSSEDVSREDDNGNIRTKRQGSEKKINQVNKVCSGSVSRGLEKFS